MSLLKCEGLVKDYPGKRAVDGVDFEVNEGEIVGLLGPNGRRQKHHVSHGVRTDSTDERESLAAGKEITHWPMYQRAQQGLGYLPQDASIFSKLSVEDNIMAILEFRGVSRKASRARISQLLDEFGLLDKRRQRSGSLSGGERRRLEIARALASDPEILLLDEPFTGIDPVTIHSIQDIIHGLRDRGIAILLTDHRERETLTITDRSYIICAGQVLVSGSAEKVLNDPGAIENYFGRRFDASSIIDGRDSFRSAA